MRMVFLAGLIDAVTEKGRRLLALDRPERTLPPTADGLTAAAQALLTSRGEASLVAAARSLLDAYAASPIPVRLQFLRRITELLVPDPTRLDLAISAYTSHKTVGTIQALHEAAEPRRRSAGLMVNYLYDLDTIVENHEGYANHGTVAASAGVRKLLRTAPRQRNLLPLLRRPPA